MTTLIRVRRQPWLTAAMLLVLAGVAAAIATWAFWRPCRGTMLNGSVLVDHRYDESLFTRACLTRMDQGRPFPLGPGAGELGLAATGWSVLAMVLLALVWLPLIRGLDWDPRTRRLVAAPIITLGLAATLALVTAPLDLGVAGSLLGLGLMALIDVSVAVAFVRVAVREPQTRLVPLVVLAWGTSAFGMSHWVAELALMLNTSQASWDSPPGTGYPAALTLVVAGLAVIASTAGRRPVTAQAASSMASAAVSASR